MGQHIRSKAVQHGYHWDKTAYRDNMYVRCSRCGFICNLDRDLKSHPYGREGWGTFMEDVYNEYDLFKTYDTYYQAIATHYNGMGTYDMATLPTYTDTIVTYDNILNEGQFDTYDNLIIDTEDAVVNAGCPQCGTMLYNNPAPGTKG